MKHLQVDLHRTAYKLNMLQFISGMDDPGRMTDEHNPVILAQHVRGVVNWAWLQWHVSHDRSSINLTLETNVGLAMKAKESPKLKRADINDRGELDQFLLTAALLSGNPALARDVAATVTGANAKSKQYQYRAALAGMMAASILDNRRKRDAQLALMKKYKPVRINAFPSPRLVDAFIGGDDAELDRAIAAGVKKYWSDQWLDRARRRIGVGGRTLLVYEDDSRLGLDVNMLDLHWMWPHVEATFARLATLKGRKVRYDDFWFPLPFVTGVDGERQTSYAIRIMPEERPAAAKRPKRGASRAARALADLLGLGRAANAPRAAKKEIRKPPRER